ncbi:MAG TPA: sensory rhodopsin transducer [Terriglobales bacterium]|nr:sensory rhodopsin transducer [Terriglobales bacterium]
MKSIQCSLEGRWSKSVRAPEPSIAVRDGLCWPIAEGYIPEFSHGPEPEMTSHEAACLLNTSDRDANVQITTYFSDRESVGPYRITVPANRTKHLRFNDLKDPAPIPRGIDYASVIESDVPIVVQHTRLDSRQSANALITTIAYAQAD